MFEDSHVPMRLWLQAMYLLCSSKKGITSNQLSRTLGVTLKTAWFMSHRIREAMRVVGMTRWAALARSSKPTKPIIGRIEGEKKRRTGWGTRTPSLLWYSAAAARAASTLTAPASAKFTISFATTSPAKPR